MAENEEMSLGDMVVRDLERQLSEPDPRYAAKCRELAILRAQYSQLAKLVEENAERLGLRAVDEPGSSETPDDVDSRATISTAVPETTPPPAENPRNGKSAK